MLCWMVITGNNMIKSPGDSECNGYRWDKIPLGKNKSGGISITSAIVTCLIAASIPFEIDFYFAFLIYTLIRLLMFPGMNDAGTVFCVRVCVCA